MDLTLPSAEELKAMDFEQRDHWVKLIQNTPEFFDQTKAISYAYEFQYRPVVEQHEREALIKEHRMVLKNTGAGSVL